MSDESKDTSVITATDEDAEAADMYLRDHHADGDRMTLILAFALHRIIAEEHGKLEAFRLYASRAGAKQKEKAPVAEAPGHVEWIRSVCPHDRDLLSCGVRIDAASDAYEAYMLDVAMEASFDRIRRVFNGSSFGSVALRYVCRRKRTYAVDLADRFCLTYRDAYVLLNDLLSLGVAKPNADGISISATSLGRFADAKYHRISNRPSNPARLRG